MNVHTSFHNLTHLHFQLFNNLVLSSGATFLDERNRIVMTWWIILEQDINSADGLTLNDVTPYSFPAVIPSPSVLQTINVCET